MLPPAESVMPSGKFCTLVATYVAIDKPPDVTYWTRAYGFPTRVYGFVVRTSVTESMMFFEPAQKNVATTASPTCGFVGLNPLMSIVPLSRMVPFHWSSAMPLAITANRGASRARGLGPTGSLQAAASSVAATRLARPTVFVRVNMTRLPVECAPHVGRTGPASAVVRIRKGRAMALHAADSDPPPLRCTNPRRPRCARAHQSWHNVHDPSCWHRVCKTD